MKSIAKVITLFALVSMLYANVDPMDIIEDYQKISSKEFKINENITYSWSDSTWVYGNKAMYDYDSNGNLIEQLYLTRESENWVNLLKLTYIVDETGKMIEFYYQSWESENWANQLKYVYYYGTNDLVSEVDHFYWEDTELILGNKSIYSYDENSNITEILRLTWENETWVNSSRWNCNYTVDNKMLESISQSWQGTAWENSKKSNYIYIDEFLVEQIVQSWNNSNWMDSQKYEHTYEDSNNILTLFSYWYENNWSEIDKHTKYYDTDGNMIEQIMQSWVDTYWRNNSRTIYTYINTGIDNSEIRIQNFELAQNYPNPFNPSTKIIYSLHEASNVRLVIYNSAGKEVSELVNRFHSKGVHMVDFKSNNLTSGIYFYSLVVNGQTKLNKKMILSK